MVLVSHASIDHLSIHRVVDQLFLRTPCDSAELTHHVIYLVLADSGLFIPAEDVVEFLVVVGDVHLVEVVVGLGWFLRLGVEVLGVDGVVAV